MSNAIEVHHGLCATLTNVKCSEMIDGIAINIQVREQQFTLFVPEGETAHDTWRLLTPWWKRNQTVHVDVNANGDVLIQYIRIGEQIDATRKRQQ